MSGRHCACGTPIGANSLTGRCHGCGVRAGLRRAVPGDFAVRAVTLRNHELALHYACNPGTIARWRAAVGVAGPPQVPANQRPIPDGFAEAAQRCSAAELGRRFELSPPAVRRMCRTLGVTPPRGKSPGRGAGRAAMLRSKARGFAPQSQPQRDMSGAGQAADFLRHYGPVFRCDEAGHACRDGGWWNRGGFVLSDDEVVGRARRMGFGGGGSASDNRRALGKSSPGGGGGPPPKAVVEG